MIYIDNGNSVIEYHTHPKTEQAIQAILDEIDGLVSGESIDGMTVRIVNREGE